MSWLWICLVVLLAGVLLLRLGPQGWRTYIKGALIAGFPLLGEILDWARSLDLNQVLDGRTAAGAMIGIGLLIVIYKYINNRLYGAVPKG